jgi:protein-S-isoprenylcysteine O-methyltransferase Ste14
MQRRLVKPLLILPGSVLVLIPVLIVWLTNDTAAAAVPVSFGQTAFWPALLVGGIGLGLCVWTVRIFKDFGRGTPAPWDPPENLVIRGPYRHVRNPMIIGVLLLLTAEAILLQSWPIAMWTIAFFIGNALYFPLVEEKGLERRFGRDYRFYKAHVPRWIPRLRPWKPSGETADTPPEKP